MNRMYAVIKRAEHFQEFVTGSRELRHLMNHFDGYCLGLEEVGKVKDGSFWYELKEYIAAKYDCDYTYDIAALLLANHTSEAEAIVAFYKYFYEYAYTDDRYLFEEKQKKDG